MRLYLNNELNREGNTDSIKYSFSKKGVNKIYFREPEPNVQYNYYDEIT